MQEILIYVNVKGMEDELDVDIAGFDCVGDLQTHIEEQVEEFNENDAENCAEVKGWKVTDINNADDEVKWVLQETLDPENWEWEWIEHLGLNNLPLDDVAICEAAFDLDITCDNYEEAYSGEFRNDEVFAEDLAEQTDSVPAELSWPCNCIDWEQAAREIMQDYCEQNNYYFRIM